MATFGGGGGGSKAAMGREIRMSNVEGEKNFNLYHSFTVIDICSVPVNEKDAALS